MIRVHIPSFLPHVGGPHRTTWHYRTGHDLEQILAAGNSYWVPVSSMVRRGDEILVEDASYRWQYSLLVLGADPNARYIEVVIPRSKDRGDGVMILPEAKGLDIAPVQPVAKPQDAEDDTDETTTSGTYTVSWGGPSHKFRVMDGSTVVRVGYPTKTEAWASIKAAGA